MPNSPQLSLRQAVLAWLAADSDPETRAELADLLDRSEIDSSAADELRRRFDGRLHFGTAGLRARLGAGPTRMNRVVVRQVTAAVMASLPRDAKVVIGHDARKNSAVFASEAGRVVDAAGGCALMLGQVPTPVVAHAVGDRSAQAGVVITASHNPPGDNGYKLYAADGAQIVSPADAEVEALMSQIPPGSIHTLPQGVDAGGVALEAEGLGSEAEGLRSKAAAAAEGIKAAAAAEGSEVSGEEAIQRYLDAVVGHLAPCDASRRAVPTGSWLIHQIGRAVQIAQLRPAPRRHALCGWFTPLFTEWGHASCCSFLNASASPLLSWWIPSRSPTPIFRL